MSRKVKFDIAFKLECIQQVVKEGKSDYAVSKSKGISDSLLYRWLSLYEKNGEGALAPRRNRSYAVSFKLKVLQTIERKNLSLSEAQGMFDIPSASVIVKWKKDFITFGISGLEEKPRGLPKRMNHKREAPKVPLTRLEELELEVERLRCENAFLKKLRALIQAEERENQKRLQKPSRN
jgi:transposase